MILAKALVLVFMSILFYPLIAPVLTVYWMFEGRDTDQLREMWSIPFTVAEKSP